MNILIIGNGFDLAHNIPTKYSNFLDFVKAFMEPGTGDYSAFIDDVKKNNTSLFLEIEKLIENNILLEYFLSIYADREKEGKENWIDFESEIAFIVQKMDEAKQYLSAKISGPEETYPLEKGLFQYLKPIIVKSKPGLGDSFTSYPFQPRFFDYQATVVLDALNRLTRLLEIYLYEYVDKIDCDYKLVDIQELGVNSVLSFNYTTTYQKKYDPEEKCQYCYVHGKIHNSSIDKCNLVLGIDEYLSSDRKDNDNQFVWFKKFYQRIYKETGSEYLDWMKAIEDFNKRHPLKPLITNIYIYGHSLDVTDKDIISKLILMENTITNIYYHNRDAMAKQISNLVKVIGEDNLIRMTGGKEKSIRFIQSVPAVKEKGMKASDE